MTVNYAIAQGGRGGTVLRMTVKYAERARGGTQNYVNYPEGERGGTQNDCQYMQKGGGEVLRMTFNCHQLFDG